MVVSLSKEIWHSSCSLRCSHSGAGSAWANGRDCANAGVASACRVCQPLGLRSKNLGVWYKSIVGVKGIARAVEYWNHGSTQVWVQNHPGLTDRNLWPHTIPFTVHGDGAQCTLQGKRLVLHCSSALSTDISMCNRFLFAALPDKIASKGMRADELCKVLVWCFDCLTQGVWPAKDHLGRPMTG